jgi:ParB family chromosome partitioning protein
MPPAVAPVAADADVVRQLDLAAVVPNPQQPRTHFDPTELQGLADSIREHGVLQPIVVSDRGTGRYELIAGERRLRASKLAGRQTVPAIIRSFGEQQKLELAVIENVQRTQLNPLETAAAYRKLTDEFNLTLDQISARVGKAKSTVANIMRLLQLPAAARQALESGAISEAHGRAILAVADPTRQVELLQHITTEGWTVRQAEAFARNAKPPVATAGAKIAAGGVRTVAANSFITQELGNHLGTKVGLQPTAKGGRLVIEYHSDEELQRIFEKIKSS